MGLAGFIDQLTIDKDQYVEAFDLLAYLHSGK